MHLALEHGASESLVRTFFEAYPEAVSHSGRYETLLVVDPPSDPRSHRPIPSSEQLKAVASLHDCWVTSRTADLHAREVSGLRTELEGLRQAVASLKNMGLSLKRDNTELEMIFDEVQSCIWKRRRVDAASPVASSDAAQIMRIQGAGCR